MRRNHGQPDALLVRPVSQLPAIGLPDALAFGLDGGAGLELGEQEGRQHVRWKIAGAYVDPRILVHLSAKEPGPVCPFLAYDLRALKEGRLIHQKSSPLAAGEILRLMKTLRRQRSKGTQFAAAIGAEQAVRIVFHNGDLMGARNSHDDVHLTSHAGIMNWNDRLRAPADGSFDQPLVEIQGVRPDVDEYRPRASQHKRIDSGYKGKRGHDDFIARPNIEEERRHFQRVSAGGGQ